MKRVRMPTMRRSAMRPGQVFGVWDSDRSPWVDGFRDAMIVVDAKTEIGFWTGAVGHFGDIAPGSCFEVLA